MRTSTYFNSDNIDQMHFIVLGKTDDIFCNEALQIQHLEEVLHSHLIKQGYKRIVFYSPKKKIYFYDPDSKVLTLNDELPQKKIKRTYKLDDVNPIGCRVQETSESDALKSSDESLSIGKRMSGQDVIDKLNHCMQNKKIKTALIITDTDEFITTFREQRSERGVDDITSELANSISEWENYRTDSDNNVIVWIFRMGNFTELPDNYKENGVFRRFFKRMFEEEAHKRQGTIIEILTPSSGEIKNLINYHRLVEGLPVKMLYLEEAVLELEKKAKGHRLSKEDISKSLNLRQISRRIKQISKNGICIENIEEMCGKKDRISVFVKIKQELEGMKNFIEYIERLKVKANNDKLQKTTRSEFCERIVRKHIEVKPQWKNLHLALVGNPGTGKTTVARRMGEVYHELGLLSTGHVIKVTKDDLCAGFVGQTAIKTKERINEAMGGVLFIDEAYTLARGGEKDYGQEAIDTIVEAMTDRMGQFAVIIAGYPDDIDILLSKNEGLSSRFDEIIKLEDFTANEMSSILTKHLTKYELTLSSELQEKLELFLQNYYDDTPKGKGGKWANARTVLALAEKMKDACILNNENIADIKHVPQDLQRYINETKPKTNLPEKIKMDELDLPEVNYLKTNGGLNIKKIEQAVPFIITEKNEGSGFIISPNGYIITCEHVIENAKEIYAIIKYIIKGSNIEKMLPEKKLKCLLLKKHKELDIALLKIEDDELKKEEIKFPFLKLDKDFGYKYEKGGKIGLFGFPFGSKTAEDCSYREGHNSSKRTDENNFDCINIGILAESGFSGGAIIDTQTGLVIGVFPGSITNRNEQLGVEQINWFRPIRYFLSPEFVI